MKRNVRLAALMLFVAIPALTLSCSSQSPPPQPKASDKSLLVGSWVRTDAPYRIQISELADDGKLKVGYFNPKSINVDKASWTLNGGVTQLYIELKDVNYPGSNYNLVYLPEKDILAGDYFQAVERTTFKVEFSRAK